MSKMFSLSEASSLAIHSLAIIAKSKEKINVNGIAEITNFSKSHLAKVLQRLVKHKYISSERGPNGGFLINNKVIKKTTLLEIYELMEGKLEPEECGVHKYGCPFSTCIFGGMSQKYTTEFRDFLKRKTLFEAIK